MSNAPPCDLQKEAEQAKQPFRQEQEQEQDAFSQEPGEPWTMTYEEREILVKRKMVELRAKRWEEEIEQEARRRIAKEDREQKRRLDEQEIAEIEALLDEEDAGIRVRGVGSVKRHKHR
jgi:hypothetical protein